MYKLDIDFYSLLPHIIDAYTHVFGEEYRSIITEKVNRTLIVYYTDADQIEDYVKYLKKCKKNELVVRFLDALGYDVSKYNINNYCINFDNKDKEVVDTLISWSFCFSDNLDFINSYVPINAFNPKNKKDPDYLMPNKLNIINFLLPDDHDKITKENFPTFIQTKEYRNILNRINRIRSIYKKLYNEFQAWKVSFSELDYFLKLEENRKKQILQNNKEIVFKKVFLQLPDVVKEIIGRKPYKEQIDAILGPNDIGSFISIKYFSLKCWNILRSDNESLSLKSDIIFWQYNYLKTIGVNVEFSNFDINTEKDFDNYLNYINQDEIKKYIPSFELVDRILKLRKKYYRRAVEKYYQERNDFLKNLKMFINNPVNFRTIYRNLRTKQVCILSHGGYDERGFKSMMFFSKRDAGFLAHDILHEFGHVITQKENVGIGFESSNDYDDAPMNPYDKRFRIHEKLNETLDDMVTLEANDYLRKKDIYLIEPFEITNLDSTNHNTSTFNKDLLRPLFQKFRKHILDAYINTDPNAIKKYIGEDNYEELCDVVNKVDYLVKQGLRNRIKENPNDSIVIEYYEQIDRAKRIYMNIDRYYHENFSIISFSDDVGIRR